LKWTENGSGSGSQFSKMKWQRYGNGNRSATSDIRRRWHKSYRKQCNCPICV